MEMCQYKQVNSTISNSGVSKWRAFLRQFWVCSGVWLSYFTFGMCVGAPTVIIPQLRREANSTAAVSIEMASWMSSIPGFAGIPWVFILPLLTERCGRKLSFLFLSFSFLCSFIILYFSSTVTHIIIGEILQGTIQGGYIAINITIITEYSSPRYRGIFLTIKSATFSWGFWSSNALGTFFHWKMIPVLGIICSVYCMVSIVFSVESPYWLASKGHFEKCAVSHRWLKGTNEDSEKELEKLIEIQKIYLKNNISSQNKNSFRNVIFSGDFCKPLTLCLVMISLHQLSGKTVCAVYSIDIIKKITGDEPTAYTGMLILDGVTVLGMYVGCVLSKFFKRRTLLLSGATIGILFLYLMSLYLYLIKLSIIIENNYVSIGLLAIFSLAICSGPMLMCTTIFGELIPLRFKSFSTIIISFYSTIIFGTSLKIAPYLFKTIKLHGAFLFYAGTSTVFTIILWKYLPETKDKTLVEIEDCLKNNSKEKRELIPVREDNHGKI